MTYLFIVDSWNDTPSANGILARRLAHCLISRGNRVIILTTKKTARLEENIISGKEIVFKGRFCLEGAFKNKIISLLYRKLRHLISFSYYPLKFVETYNIYRAINKIRYKYSFDKIVAFYAPFALLLGALKYKIKNPKINLTGYFFDHPLGGYVQGLKRHKKYYIAKIKRAECRFLELCNRAIYLLDHKTFIESNSIYTPFKRSIVYTSLPAIDNTDRNFISSVSLKAAKLNKIVYTGSLDYVDEKLVCSLIKTLPSYIFEFYGRRPIGGKIATMGNVRYGNFVNGDRLKEIYRSSPYLLLFDNGNPQMFPSKFFEYCQTGLPIIYISQFNQANTMNPFVNRVNSYKNTIFLYKNELHKLPQKLVELQSERARCAGSFNLCTFENNFVTNCISALEV